MNHVTEKIFVKTRIYNRRINSSFLDPNNEIKSVGVLWWEWLFNRGTTLLLNANNEEVQVESSYLKQTTNLMGTTILLIWV